MMQFSSLFSVAVAITTAAAASAPSPGYLTGFSTVNDTTLSFGKKYAILNLDMINGTVAGISSTPEGQEWIKATSSWTDAVHQKSPRPLNIYTRIYFSSASRPDVNANAPFAKAAAGLGNITSSSPASQIYPAFKTDDEDVILQKIRYSATVGNPLLDILESQDIDTVVMSGLRTSGVILATTYALFDKNYKVYVIGDNCIESPGQTASAIDSAIKTGIIPTMPADVITLQQALDALARSG